MPPKFSLQAVLDYRHTRVESLEVELGELLNAQRQGEALLLELQQKMKHLFITLQAQQAGDIDLFEVSILRSNIKTTQDQIDQVVQALVILEEKVTKKRNELVQAKQDEEALQTLKNKEKERYFTELKLRELRSQDEIYIAQAFRKRAQEY